MAFGNYIYNCVCNIKSGNYKTFLVQWHTFLSLCILSCTGSGENGLWVSDYPLYTELAPSKALSHAKYSLLGYFCRFALPNSILNPCPTSGLILKTPQAPTTTYPHLTPAASLTLAMPIARHQQNQNGG